METSPVSGSDPGGRQQTVFSKGLSIRSIRKAGNNYRVDAYRKGVRLRRMVGPNRRVAKEVLTDIEGRLVRQEYGNDISGHGVCRWRFFCGLNRHKRDVLDCLKRYKIASRPSRLKPVYKLSVVSPCIKSLPITFVTHL